MKKALLLLIVVGSVWKLYHYSGEVSLGPGVMAPDFPRQTNISSAVSFSFREYNITEVAEFTIRAKVLAKKNYRIGREADLSPIDLALGWGNMSDESVLENIKISQSGRFYRWRVDTFQYLEEKLKPRAPICTSFLPTILLSASWPKFEKEIL
tara:strand:- start:22579 stop:23037 length:459 start_codon:yes stop_codon:yes gene_type:complete